MKILVAIYSDVRSWCIPDANVASLRARFPEHSFVRADSDEQTRACIADADVAFSSRIEPQHLAAASRLRWIHSPAAGVGSMLFPAMVASPVVMTNSRGISAVTIAEHVVAVTLALFRDLRLAWRRQAEHEWAQDEFNAGRSVRTLSGSRALVVGLGAIGSETARLLAAFGAEVTGIRRRVDLPPPSGVRTVHPPAALTEALAASDLVVIAAPNTPETRHLIGVEELARMKQDSVLVNVSRGSLVDERALIDALDRGPLGGAALDVFEREPLPPESPLWTHPRVLVTPHVSGFQRHYWRDATALFADNLRRFTGGEPLRNVVDKEAGY
jgi:phosphoglycerate dehydrogenase-like enzyme